MWVEQAIYTSLPRAGRAGYHVVSRSAGVSDDEVRALASWSPSHGALLVDASNRVSVNFHPLIDGRLALSRSCEGLPEYSGRGGRQIYTHALILDSTQLERSGGGPIAIYRDALSLGHFRYRPDPKPILDPVELGRCHGPADLRPAADPLLELGLGELDDSRQRLVAGEVVQLRFPGDRIHLAECLLAPLPTEIVAAMSFSTSLQPSPTRPYRLVMFHS